MCRTRTQICNVRAREKERPRVKRRRGFKNERAEKQKVFLSQKEGKNSKVLFFFSFVCNKGEKNVRHAEMLLSPIKYRNIGDKSIPFPYMLNKS